MSMQLLSRGAANGMMFRILLSIHDDFQMALGFLFRSETEFSPWALSLLVGPFTMQLSGAVSVVMKQNDEFLESGEGMEDEDV